MASVADSALQWWEEMLALEGGGVGVPGVGGAVGGGVGPELGGDVGPFVGPLVGPFV